MGCSQVRDIVISWYRDIVAGHTVFTGENLHRFADANLPCKLETYWAPVRIDLGNGEEIVGFPMFCVHEYLAVLWDAGPDRFATTCFRRGGEDDLGKFRERVSGEPWYTNHPVSREPDRLKSSIPATVFGDDARVFKET
jgi:hypothetical protein